MGKTRKLNPRLLQFNMSALRETALTRDRGKADQTLTESRGRPELRVMVCWVWVLVLILVGLTSPAWGWDSSGQVRVRWVPDGDTLYLHNGQVIRLKGIDAPEMDHGGGRDQYFARKSRDGLKSLVQDRPLQVEASTAGIDRYQRMLAEVRLPDGRLLSRVMLEQGLAFYFPHPDQKLTDPEALLSAQKEAMVRERGFWDRLLSMKKAGQAYMGNRRSKRFHDPNCRYGKRMNARNRVEFRSLREAFAAGYAPARGCTPWPDEE